MTKVEIKAGSCGSTIRIDVSKIDATTLGVFVSSDCKAVEDWGRRIGSLNWRECLGKEALSSPIFFYAAKYLKHPSCPACVGLLKAIEAEIGAALPVDAAIRFVQET